jgi:hypothetical protein
MSKQHIQQAVLNIQYILSSSAPGLLSEDVSGSYAASVDGATVRHK